jgi:hypothetical protein
MSAPRNDEGMAVGADMPSKSQVNVVSSQSVAADSIEGNKSSRRLLKLRTPPRPPIPCIEVLPSAHGTVSFWCIHCQRRHTHGDPLAWLKQPGESVGHRCAHCDDPQSPYRQRGYELIVSNEAVPGLGRLKPEDFALLDRVKKAQRDLYCTLRGVPPGANPDPTDPNAVFASAQIDALAEWATDREAEDYYDLLCGGFPDLWRQFVTEADVLLDKFQGGRQS